MMEILFEFISSRVVPFLVPNFLHVCMYWTQLLMVPITCIGPNCQWTLLDVFYADPYSQTLHVCCRFRRYFITIGPMLNIIWNEIFCGGFVFSKHGVYRQGYLHLLTTRDDGNKTITLQLNMSYVTVQMTPLPL